MAYDNPAHWNNLYSEHFNLAGSGWTELGEAYNYWLYKLRVKVFNKALVENNIALNRNNEVLDIGCVTGFFITYFQKRKLRNVVGCDLTRISVEKLRVKFPQYVFFQQDISGQLKRNDKFDFIIIYDVLWYLDDTGFEKALVNLANLSKSGSYIFITDIFFNQGNNLGGEGMWMRSIPEYENHLNKHTLEIIAIYPLFIFSNNPCDHTYENKYFLSFLVFQWKIVYRILTRYNFTGNLLGPLFFIIDLVLLRFMKNGPSAKMVVLRKI